MYIYLGDEVPLIICSSSLPPPVLIDPKPGRPHNTATSHTHTPVLSCWITAVKRSQSWSWSLPRRPLLQNHLLHSKYWIACTALTHTHTHAPTYTYLLTHVLIDQSECLNQIYSCKACWISVWSVFHVGGGCFVQWLITSPLSSSIGQLAKFKDNSTDWVESTTSYSHVQHTHTHVHMESELGQCV